MNICTPPELYNKKADFAVISIRNLGWYPKDCCKIVNYNQMTKLLKKSRMEKNTSSYRPDWRSYLLPEIELQDYNFLVVKTLGISLRKENIYTFLYNNKDYKPGSLQYRYSYSPITPCGKTLWLW